MAPIPEFPKEKWDRSMNVMVNGPCLAMEHAWPALTTRPHCRIIVTASVPNTVVEPFKAAHVAAKHGVLGLVKVKALEGPPVGLTPNAVDPGGMLTPLIGRQLDDHIRLRGICHEEVSDGFVQRHAIKRLVETQEVSNVIAVLAGPESSSTTDALAQQPTFEDVLTLMTEA